LTPNWRLQGSVAHTDAVEENMFLEWKAWQKQIEAWLATRNTAGVVSSTARTVQQELALIQERIADDTARDGATRLGNRRYKVSMFTRYNLPFERLKGAYIGGGYRHQSKMFAGYSTAGQVEYGNSFSNLDLLAGYR
jgi:hypothetical protein